MLIKFTELVKITSEIFFCCGVYARAAYPMIFPFLKANYRMCGLYARAAYLHEITVTPVLNFLHRNKISFYEL